jgi:hypothetical protein
VRHFAVLAWRAIGAKWDAVTNPLPLFISAEVLQQAKVPANIRRDRHVSGR